MNPQKTWLPRFGYGVLFSVIIAKITTSGFFFRHSSGKWSKWIYRKLSISGFLEFFIKLLEFFQSYLEFLPVFIEVFQIGCLFFWFFNYLLWNHAQIWNIAKENCEFLTSIYRKTRYFRFAWVFWRNPWVFGQKFAWVFSIFPWVFFFAEWKKKPGLDRS